MSIALRPHDLPRLPVSIPEVTAGANPWALETWPGWYHQAYARDGAVYYARSHFSGPPLAFEATVTTPGGGEVDSEPRMAMDWTRKLHVVYTRTAGGTATVRKTTGDDDGLTWRDDVELFTGAAHPTVSPEHPADRTLIFLARRASDGALRGRVQGPGDSSPAAAVTLQVWDGAALADLVVDDDTFHLVPSRAPESKWVLVATVSGSIRNYLCADEDSLTFKEA